MRFRLPMKSLLRDFAIMFCGSLLGLFLSRAFVSDPTLDQCSPVHMVKRKDFGSSNDNAGRGKNGGISWISWSRSLWNSSSDDAADVVTDGGWGEEPKEEITLEGEEDDLEYVPGAKSKSPRGGRRPGTSRFWGSRNGSSFRRKPLLVGVVTEEHHLQTTITDVMATWGQGSKDLLFYSLRWLKGAVAGAGKGSSRMPTVYKKTRHQKTSKDSKSGLMVVSLEAEKRNVQPLISEAITVLQHMYANMADLYDWFMFVPNNTYIRLDDIEQLLSDKDSSSYLILGSPPRKKNKDMEGACDDQVGVVFSRALLTAIGSLLQLAEGKNGSGDDTTATCTRDGYTYFSCITQKLGVDCIHDYQANHIFKDADSVLPYILNSTQYSAHIPLPLPSSMYTLHQHYLKQDLDRSLAESSNIRSKMARNIRELKHRTR